MHSTLLTMKFKRKTSLRAAGGETFSFMWFFFHSRFMCVIDLCYFLKKIFVFWFWFGSCRWSSIACPLVTKRAEMKLAPKAEASIGKFCHTAFVVLVGLFYFYFLFVIFLSFSSPPDDASVDAAPPPSAASVFFFFLARSTKFYKSRFLIPFAFLFFFLFFFIFLYQSSPKKEVSAADFFRGIDKDKGKKPPVCTLQKWDESHHIPINYFFLPFSFFSPYQPKGSVAAMFNRKAGKKRSRPFAVCFILFFVHLFYVFSFSICFNNNNINHHHHHHHQRKTQLPLPLRQHRPRLRPKSRKYSRRLTMMTMKRLLLLLFVVVVVCCYLFFVVIFVYFFSYLGFSFLLTAVFI